MQFIGGLVQAAFIEYCLGAGELEQAGIPAIFESHAGQFSIFCLLLSEEV